MRYMTKLLLFADLDASLGTPRNIGEEPNDDHDDASLSRSHAANIVAGVLSLEGIRGS
jgi:hypothetical protein